jgi:hypothetical protein
VRDAHSVRHQEQTVARDADQTEKVAILTGSTVIDAGVRDDVIADALEDDEFDPAVAGLADDEPGRERWHRLDLGVEGGVSAISGEIERRIKYLGTAYPFDLDRGTLTYRGPSSGFYEYCLGISLAPTITTGAYVQLPRTFERVAALLTKLYMGVHTELFNSGAPRDAPYGTWKSAMEELRQLTGEWWWHPQEGLPNAPTVGGDGTIDFVVWKKQLDKRAGNIFVLGQCACGGNWDQKLDELSLRALGAWFHPVSWVDPIRAFATPFVLSDGNFKIAHLRAGWVLDRIRLTAIAEQVKDDAEYMAWEAKLSAMVALAIPKAA